MSGMEISPWKRSGSGRDRRCCIALAETICHGNAKLAFFRHDPDRAIAVPYGRSSRGSATETDQLLRAPRKESLSSPGTRQVVRGLQVFCCRCIPSVSAFLLGGLGEFGVIGIALGSWRIEGRGVPGVEVRIQRDATRQIGIGDEEFAEGDRVRLAGGQGRRRALRREAFVGDIDAAERLFELRAK